MYNICFHDQQDYVVNNNSNTLCSPTDATALALAPFGQGTGPIWLDNLACLGFEDSLFNCTYDSHTADCAHFEDAGLRCQRKSSPHMNLI